MGGLMKAVAPSTPKAAAPSSFTSTTATDTAEAERTRRLEALARQRAGRAGTIVTSARGLLVPTEAAPQRKSLLGE
jgi:hypothetical protein